MLGKRLVLMLAVTAAGWVIASRFGFHELHNSSAYFFVATALLVVGLFSSTHDIELGELAGNVRLVLAAVTVGVLLKAALIVTVMLLIFRQPAFLVLAVAVAQIDPLSVAVMRTQSRLSPRARAILSAWSSFDDPVTALLAVYLSTFAWSLSGHDGAVPAVIGNLGGIGVGLLANLAFILVLGAIWAGWVMLAHRLGHRPGEMPLPYRFVFGAVLLGTGLVAAQNLLLLGVAVVGLFVRPGIGRTLNLATPIAFMTALFMLGLVLADGINVVPGIILGCAAFGAQVVAGILLTRSLRGDRARLALSQQNGITAVILALLLETVFSGTVAIVAPAVVVVGILHLASNTVLDRIEDRVRVPAKPKPAPAATTSEGVQHRPADVLTKRFQ